MRVLIVDDDVGACETLVKLFRISGIGADCVHSAALAIKHIRNHRPFLVIIDQMMPGMTGLELIAQLKSDPEFQDIPLVMFSAGAPELREAALEHGAAAFWPKTKVDFIQMLGFARSLQKSA